MNIFVVLIGLFIVGLAIRFPISNAWEYHKFKKNQLSSVYWLAERPTRVAYRKLHGLAEDGELRCDFCASKKIFSRLEYEMPETLFLGLYRNSFLGLISYHSWRCVSCGTELMREASHHEQDCSNSTNLRGILMESIKISQRIQNYLGSVKHSIAQIKRMTLDKNILNYWPLQWKSSPASDQKILPPLDSLPMDRLINFSSSALFGVRDPAEFLRLIDDAKKLVNPGFYLGDNFFAWSRNLSMFEDLVFKNLWEANSVSEEDQSKPWGQYLEICAASHCARLGGDFVFFGLGSGSGMKTVIDYLGPLSGGREYFGFGECTGQHEAILKNNSIVHIVENIFPEEIVASLPIQIAYIQIQVEDASLALSLVSVSFDRLKVGGILMIKGYDIAEHWRAHKAILDPWFSSRGYRIFPLPTGQGLVIKI